MKSSKIALIILSLIMFVPSLQAADIGFNAIGAKLGYIMPEGDIENTIGFGLQADLGTITDDIHLDAFLDFWSKGYDNGYWEWSWTTIAIGAMAKYYFPMEGKIQPYAGGGLGLNISTWKSDYTGPSSTLYSGADQSDTEIDLGLHLAGGAQMELSPSLDGFAELKYTLSEADYFGIFIGVLFELNK